MLKMLADNFTNFKNTAEILDLYAMGFENIPDDLAMETAKHVCLTNKYTPKLADMVEAANQLKTDMADKVRKREEAEREASYITYWDRSPQERAEIDIARNECMRSVRSLSDDGNVAAWENIARESIRR
jgi:hypothetical protein